MEHSIDDTVQTVIGPLARAVYDVVFFAIPVAGAQVPLIVVWLVAGGLFFTGYLRFINLRGFRHALGVVRGRFAHPDAQGEVSQFAALTTAVSGTVGVGNIAGVAVAISMGGPGAAFWMAVAGFLGMSTKFAECTLAVRYRRIDPGSGEVSGGPMYYLRRGLAEQGRARLGRGLAGFLCGGHGCGLPRHRQTCSSPIRPPPSSSIPPAAAPVPSPAMPGCWAWLLRWWWGR